MDNLDVTNKKMIFIYNAIENGWSVKKNSDSFIFTKKDEGKKEIFSNDYLLRFMNENFSVSDSKKIIFIYNAIENGWSVKKNNDSFIFTKKHEGKKEIFSNDYLLRFMKENFSVSKLLN